jgi:hypothetical protein
MILQPILIAPRPLWATATQVRADCIAVALCSGPRLLLNP